MHTGKNIGKIRELLGIKQESLAATLKISQQTISKIEQTANLTEHTVERIAIAMGVSANMIFHYNDQIIINFLKESIPTADNQSSELSNYLPFVEKIFELYERLLIAEIRLK
jgi:transcriptional regulator with XRE-family HTH domain